MWKIYTFLFLVISVTLISVIIHINKPFDPGVNLPEIEAGKPFKRWHGVVIGLDSNGKIHIDGKPAGENPEEELKNKLRYLEKNYKYLRKRMPDSDKSSNISFVPVLICLDKNDSFEKLQKILDITCKTGNANLHLAVKSKDGFRALSLCMPLSNKSICFWKNSIIRLRLTSKTKEVRAKINNGMKWRIYSRFLPIINGHIIIEMDEEIIIKKGKDINGNELPVAEPTLYDTIDPFFDLITKASSDVVAFIDITASADKIKYDWFVELLVRLEKSGIKAYSLSAPEMDY